MELRDIDLNLLVLFNELLKTGRVHTTADRLGITQPAVSNALARLRRLLGDELFVRTSQGMQPTPFAEALAEPVAYALGAIHSALNQNVVFEPARSRHAFTVAMTDIGEIYFLPALMKKLGELAPGVTIGTVRNHAIDLDREMEAGNVHLAIGLLPDLQAGYFQRRLLSQRYVCAFRRGHALDPHTLDGRPVSIEEFRAADHVGIVASGTGHGMVDEILDRSGITRNIRLRVPHFVSVGHILGETDMIATIPEVLAKRIAEPFGLSFCPHPVGLPEISIGMFWHAKYHRDPANQWLREQIANLPLGDPG